VPGGLAGESSGMVGAEVTLGRLALDGGASYGDRAFPRAHGASPTASSTREGGKAADGPGQQQAKHH
jgi:hypothetical protein